MLKKKKDKQLIKKIKEELRALYKQTHSFALSADKLHMAIKKKWNKISKLSIELSIAQNPNWPKEHIDMLRKGKKEIDK